MDTAPLRIQMLGEFVISHKDTAASVSGRSKKLCLLLAYLIRERNRPVSYNELIDLFWPGKAPDNAALNALKAILHRARVFLDCLWEGAGRSLILNCESTYQWNTDIPLVLDTEQFVRLCRSAERSKSEDRGLKFRLEALALYCGDYLPSLTGHPWVSAEAEELHQLYLHTVLQALPQLTARERWDEAADLSDAAFALEPLREDLCQIRMEALLHLNRRSESAQTFEDFQERLLAQSGVMPSDPLRNLYREVQSHCDPRALTPATLLERLREPPRAGALLCEYDFFRIVCHSMSRMADRSGEPLHVALLSIFGAGDSVLSRSSLNRVMDNLQKIIISQLRRGDAAARCGSSQFVLLLPQSTYENSQMICGRITRAFSRQFPHSPAVLRVSVQPLTSGRPAPSI